MGWLTYPSDLHCVSAFYHKACKSGTSGDSNSGCNRIWKNERSFKDSIVVINGFIEAFLAGMFYAIK